MRDELDEGDQILVKVLALEGNKIKLSRRAILKEQREKLKSEAKAQSLNRFLRKGRETGADQAPAFFDLWGVTLIKLKRDLLRRC